MDVLYFIIGYLIGSFLVEIILPIALARIDEWSTRRKERKRNAK